MVKLHNQSFKIGKKDKQKIKLNNKRTPLFLGGIFLQSIS